ncbi:RNA-binding S4 domain-containing protein [Acidovorax cavernicola]|uniref:RNA-binding S4 domain-containing protein n=1 Tax=Acidovorax cavernicola TaxID=1675792 RepID=A0A9X8D934_9BURK|nr:RNA-binding S4 domain-containing protein [Acidovorax cavernicola]RIX85043.1 RNA-binding S4 domain-containing protein [Acidovorax cavernicola]
MDRLRIDKWLWAARFFKTRSLAADEIGKNRIQVNGEVAKASREVKAGDTVAMRMGPLTRTVTVRGLSGQRGPAPVAQQLYEETPESLAAQAAFREQRRMGSEPALAIEQGRPTKRDRREIDGVRHQAEWDNRWSASIDDSGDGDDPHPPTRGRPQR